MTKGKRARVMVTNQADKLRDLAVRASTSNVRSSLILRASRRRMMDVESSEASAVQMFARYYYQLSYEGKIAV